MLSYWMIFLWNCLYCNADMIYITGVLFTWMLSEHFLLHTWSITSVTLHIPKLMHYSSNVKKEADK